MKNSGFSKKIGVVVNLIRHIPELTYKTTEEEIRERIEGKDHEFIIVKDGVNPAGFLIAYALDEETYYNWIMGVLSDFRDKGYGRQLIELFELKAMQKGYLEVSVKTMEKFPAMKYLLEKMKYEETGFDKDGKIILRKNL